MAERVVFDDEDAEAGIVGVGVGVGVQVGQQVLPIRIGAKASTCIEMASHKRKARTAVTIMVLTLHVAMCAKDTRVIVVSEIIGIKVGIRHQ